MSAAPLQTQDFWRVNSYSYPNYFSDDVKAREAWQTFESFVSSHETSYNDLKGYWASAAAPRRLEHAAVESWKATFEEFGLLYVISRSDEITITPAGFQIYEAAKHNDKDSFIWIGLNLLFRYPLHGAVNRRGRNAQHNSSDLLLYRFLYSAIRDLGDYFWWTELERILCRVFTTSEARAAFDAVHDIRATPSNISAYPLVVNNRKGAFYNSLNQVANHAGMNHLILNQDDASEHYPPPESRRRHYIDRSLLSLVNLALGDASAPTGCRPSALYVDRLPSAPALISEQDYFDYLGAQVPDLAHKKGTATPQALTIAGDTVFILNADNHYHELDESSTHKTIQGDASGLCFLARNHRVIVSTDLAWTYIVLSKELTGPDSVKITLRRARPITNIDPIQQLLGADDA